MRLLRLVGCGFVWVLDMVWTCLLTCRFVCFGAFTWYFAAMWLYGFGWCLLLVGVWRALLVAGFCGCSCWLVGLSIVFVVWLVSVYVWLAGWCLLCL